MPMRSSLNGTSSPYIRVRWRVITQVLHPSGACVTYQLKIKKKKKKMEIHFGDVLIHLFIYLFNDLL